MTDIKFCNKCLTPNSRPRVVFDKQNICNACHNAEKKKKLIGKKERENF